MGKAEQAKNLIRHIAHNDRVLAWHLIEYITDMESLSTQDLSDSQSHSCGVLVDRYFAVIRILSNNAS